MRYVEWTRCQCIFQKKEIYIVSVLDKRSPEAEAVAKECVHFASDVLDK